MATNVINTIHANHAEGYLVVHPLDDAPEIKVSVESLGAMPMTGAVRISLLSLRAYLAGMMLLVAYRVLTLAGVLGPHVK